MNYKKMQILVAISQHQNITKAAKALGLKQPTVTFHMKSLEDEMNLTIFRSKSGNIFLTEAGTALLHYAKKILLLSEDAGRVMNELSTDKRHSFNIGASMIPGTYLLPGILVEFNKQNPELSISITVKTAPTVRQMLCDYSIDVGVISTDFVMKDEISYSKLCNDIMVLAYSPSNPLANCTFLDPKILETQHFILHTPNSTTRMLTEKWEKHINISINSFTEIDSIEVIKQAVIKNAGISVLSALSIKNELQSGSLMCSPLPASVSERGIYVIYNKERFMLPIVQKFLDYLYSSDFSI